MEFTKEKILTLAVIFSIIGISALYAFTAKNSARNIELSDIDEELLGSRVDIDGTISDISWLSYTVLFELKEKDVEESLTVVIDRETIEEHDEKKQIRPGARVRVEGEVQEYENDIQLKIDSVDDISVEEEAYSDFISIKKILENADWYDGMEVKIRGNIEDIDTEGENDNLIISDLEDENYRITCEVERILDKNEIEILKRPVVVKGSIEYDSSTGSWLIRASSPLEFKSTDSLSLSLSGARIK